MCRPDPLRELTVFPRPPKWIGERLPDSGKRRGKEVKVGGQRMGKRRAGREGNEKEG